MNTPNKDPKSDGFEQALDELCVTLTNEARPYYHSDLQPFESFADFLKERLKQQITAFKNSFIHGYVLVLEKIASQYPSEKQAKYHIPPDLWENLQNVEESLGEDTLQEVLVYTEEMMAEIYALAMRYYQAKDYDNSADLFLFLANLNPYIGWFWQGLGRSWQGLQRDEEALFPYILAINCLPYEIESYQDAARCFIKCNHYDKALDTLHYGLELVAVETNKEPLQKLQHALKAMIAYTEKLKREGNKS